jgi:ubiquinone/menaquinone biosynthesis C-methylase UbiE
VKTTTLSRLCCPLCGASLAIEKVVVPEPDGVRFGVLSCSGCQAAFPVLAGVVIFGAAAERLDIRSETTEASVRQGARVGDLVEHLRSGRAIEAFGSALVPSDHDPDLLFRGPTRRSNLHKPLDRPLVPRRIQRPLNRYLGGRLFDFSQRRLAKLLFQPPAMTATDVIDLYYGHYSRSEMANYFKFRFGQPRHLAALGMAWLLKRRPGPLLDLACGAGHLTHFLATTEAGSEAQPVIGVDRDFFRLYLAQNFICPSADFVCAWADRPLPFPDQVFDGAFCSDAFHYFVDKAGSLRELSRVTTEDALLVISRAANRDLEPHEGYELTPDGYDKLCQKFQHVILGENELLESYLKGQSPNLSAARSAEQLATEKWLSLALKKGSGNLPGSTAFGEFPHRAGELGLNPIYRVSALPDSSEVELRFEFPSAHYAREDAAYTAYAPAEVRVSKELLRRAREGLKSPAVDELVRQLVLIGLPARYTSLPVA